MCYLIKRSTLSYFMIHLKTITNNSLVDMNIICGSLFSLQNFIHASFGS